MKNTYLAMDVGNVLCNVNLNLFTMYLRDPDEFLHKFNELHDIGFTTIRKELEKECYIDTNFLLSQWEKTIVPNKEMIDFIDHLCSKYNIKLALLSNMGLEHLELMHKHLGSLWDNSVKYFSYQVGARKPSYVYYNTFLSMYPEFKGCIYVDDLIQNLEAGEKFGFKSHYLSLEDGKIMADRLSELELAFIKHNFEDKR